MIAGEQKAGTTYLQANLARHPDIFMTKLKEPLFFSKKDYVPENVSHYLTEQFSDAGNERWVGEASALYFHHPQAMHRIKDAFGTNLRFIICLRHPTEKYISLYLHNYRRGRLLGSEPILETTPQQGMDLANAQHANAMARVISLFGRENVCFLHFETLRNNPHRFVTDAFSFLEVEDGPAALNRALNVGNELVVAGDHLTIAEAPKEGQVRPRFSRDELLDVHSRLQSDINLAEKISGLDLSEWRLFPFKFDEASRVDA
ncbi:sulfotransferase [Mesorhizobium sp. J428]|uniref:sulfotransferase n=1 Tax=Mesorhizobium sp. J428 TaxID=2898440 RepID=UPI002150844B|nr:sulfotransferase [Mesorhizobium sp. J428]MCR5858303.1 sulfotransferase [Mesorhizobium sp. J428]